MRTIEQVLELFPGTVAADWTQTEAGGWVHRDAVVRDSAVVCGGAVVSDNAVVCGGAVVRDNAVVSGCAVVSDNAVVRGTAGVDGHAVVCGGAVVSDNAVVCGGAVVRDHAVVSGCAVVRDHAVVRGSAVVCDSAVVSGGAVVRDNAVVSDHAVVSGVVYAGEWSTSPLYIQGSKWAVCQPAPGRIRIGCQDHSIAEWRSEGFGAALADKHILTAAQVAEYTAYVNLPMWRE